MSAFVRTIKISIITSIITGAGILALGTQSLQARDYGARGQQSGYTKLVYAIYNDLHNNAQNLQNSVKSLLDTPNDITLKAAKEAWLQTHKTYNHSKSFLSYNGPADFYNNKTGERGPAWKMDAWPIYEQFIDYNTEPSSKLSLIENTSIPLTEDTITALHMRDDESEITLGLHVIEFLLWGQDLSPHDPGNRPAADYTAGDPINDRRRTYLKLVTDIFLKDTTTLTTAWAPKKDNYAAAFRRLEQGDALRLIFKGLEGLSGFELSGKMMGSGMIAGFEEDEESRFSDNTHNDLLDALKSLESVYFCRYKGLECRSLHELMQNFDIEMANNIEVQFDTVRLAIKAIPTPLDYEVMRKPNSNKYLPIPKSHEGRIKLEAAMREVIRLHVFFWQAATKIGVMQWSPDIEFRYQINDKLEQ